MYFWTFSVQYHVQSIQKLFIVNCGRKNILWPTFMFGLVDMLFSESSGQSEIPKATSLKIANHVTRGIQSEWIIS